MTSQRPPLQPRQLVYFYPPYYSRGKAYQLCYRVIKRGWELRINGTPSGTYRHADHALLAILKHRTGWAQDELPKKYRAILTQIEHVVGLKFEGLPEK